MIWPTPPTRGRGRPRMATKTRKTATKTAAKKKQQQKPQKRRVPLVLIAFVAIAAALIAAMALSGDEPIGSGGEYGDPTINGAELPAMAPGVSIIESDPANGSVAPTVTGEDFDGSTVSIEHDGTPKAIVFLAHWCDHCRAEVPKVQSWLDSGGGVAGVEMISVTTYASSGRPNWPPSSWFESEGWTTSNIRDDQDSSIMNAYGGNSVPYWVFLNGDGTVALRIAGSIDIPTLELAMQSLLAG